MSNTPQSIALYGSTGSIGTQTLDVIRAHPERFKARILAAGTRLDELKAQAIEFKPAIAIIASPASKQAFDECATALANQGTQLLAGEDAMVAAARDEDYDIMVGAVTGAAGLMPNIEAVKRGKRVGLANKESLVMTGPILTNLARQHNAELVPIDSEHSAIWQCLRGESSREVLRVILTASGGPFRTTPLTELKEVTREQALKHPTWDMGPKISIDSSTLFNKALEIIEARWLFDLTRDQLHAVIHPQSFVHSMVEFVDGSIMAHMGATDMRIPIQLALSWPDRLPCPAPRTDFRHAMDFQFEPVDFERFPALKLGYEVAEAGGTAGAVFNAANEVAVDRFLRGEIRYLDIFNTVEGVLKSHTVNSEPSLGEVLDADRWARDEAQALKF